MRIPDIGDPFAIRSGIRTRKGHDPASFLHHFVQDRRNGLFIRDIHTDDIIIPLLRGHQPLLLILRRCRVRRHIFISDGDPAVQILPLRLLHAKRHGIPPRMDDLVGEIEIIMVLLRHIRIQFMIKIHSASDRLGAVIIRSLGFRLRRLRAHGALRTPAGQHPGANRAEQDRGRSRHHQYPVLHAAVHQISVRHIPSSCLMSVIPSCASSPRGSAGSCPWPAVMHYRRISRFG